MTSEVVLHLTGSEASFIMEVCSNLLADHKSDYEKGDNPMSMLSYNEVCKLLKKLERRIGV